MQRSRIESERHAAKLNAKQKTNGSIRNAEQEKKTCNPLGRKFLTTLFRTETTTARKKKRFKQTCRRKKREYISDV